MNEPSLVPVDPARLQAVADTWQDPETTAPSANRANGTAGNGHLKSRLLVEKWLGHYGVEFRVKKEQTRRGTGYVLKECPFDASHGGPDSCIMQDADGKLSFHCFHDSCRGRDWQQAKEKIGLPRPEHYDPPLRTPAVGRKGQRAGSGATAWDRGGDAAEADRPNEADDDPFRLARVYLGEHQDDGQPTRRFWRDQHYAWDGRAYHVLPDKELRAELARAVKGEFDRLNLWELQKWKAAGGVDPKGKATPAPVARKVTVRGLADAALALNSLTVVPASEEMPRWLGDGPVPFPARETVVCTNGLVHLPSAAAGKPRTHPLTPRFFGTAALGYPFRADAPAPAKWVEFLGRLWPRDPEAVAALQEWFGYSLLPDTSQQKILMIVGPKRSGKGTIARVLGATVGPAKVCAPTLASLGTNFGLWPLLGKSLAIVMDARLSGRTDAAVVLERLLSISGEDVQTVDRKNLPHVTARLPVRFVILTNELPRLNDPSGAIVSRLVVLRLTESFYGREDHGLTDRLLGELPSILLWAVEGWRRLNGRGHFAQPESGRRLVAELEDLASPVGAFLRDACEVGPGYEVFVRDLFGAWRRWCEAKGRKDAGTEQTFGRDLRAALPAVDVKCPRVGEARVRKYVGLRLSPGEPEIPD